MIKLAEGQDSCPPSFAWQIPSSNLGSKKKDRAIPAAVLVLCCTHGKPYAISGILFTDCSAVICFFNHTLALHRPTNGAAAIIPNEIPKAICIQLLLSPRGLD
jgi:hypothetical protein